MKVYKIIPTAVFTCGLAIIAANSKKEAMAAIDPDDYKEFGCKTRIIPGLNYEGETTKKIIDTINYE